MTSALNDNPELYESHGYCVFREVLTSDEVTDARTSLDQLIALMPKSVTVYRDGQSVTTEARPEFLTEPHAKPNGETWLQLCCHPRVLDAVEQVLGPDLLLIMSHLIVKRSGDGLPVAWHQDATYWHSVQGNDLCTVWLAIDDADAENGCMKVIPQTQLGRERLEKVDTTGGDLLGTKVAVSAELEARAIPVELRAGDLSIHDSFIIHGSDPNVSSRRRAGFTMRFANARTTRIDVDAHWVEVYRVRGEAVPGERFRNLSEDCFAAGS